jgi:hypothetical protein
LPDVTVARTRSPALKPLTVRRPLADVRGNPYLSTRHIWRVLCPVALISSGLTPSVMTCAGVDFPTQAASIQWALGRSRTVRLYLVSPPDPVSTGSPKTFNCSNSAHRVAFNAAASFNGSLARLAISGNPNIVRAGVFIRAAHNDKY